MGAYEKEKAQVVEISRRLVEKGFLIGTGGNVSVRVAGERALAVTPSNFDYEAMQVQDICIQTWDNTMVEGERKPSIETSLHAAIYEKRADVNVVIHTHQIYASAFALMNRNIPALFDEQVRFLGRQVEVVPYAPSGTPILKWQIVRKLRSHANAYILQNHGAVLMGDTAERAIFNVELLEKCALTYLLTLCADHEATRIPLAVREIAFSKLRKDQEREKQKKAALETGDPARKDD